MYIIETPANGQLLIRAHNPPAFIHSLLFFFRSMWSRSNVLIALLTMQWSQIYSGVHIKAKQLDRKLKGKVCFIFFPGCRQSCKSVHFQYSPLPVSQQFSILHVAAPQTHAHTIQASTPQTSALLQADCAGSEELTQQLKQNTTRPAISVKTDVWPCRLERARSSVQRFTATLQTVTSLHNYLIFTFSVW